VRRALLLVAVAVLALGALAPAAGAQQQRTSLTEIEDEVMCITCNVALNIAESPQADRQRAFIRELVDDGATKQQVKDALVAEYGREVLALPDGRGFGIAAYAVPIALVLLLVGVLLTLVPRWRARRPVDAGQTGTTTAATAGASPAAALSPGDAARLDADLRRFDG
jgi:cytochrome c-type biogenesis protein CcmH/NrfF